MPAIAATGRSCPANRFSTTAPAQILALPSSSATANPRERGHGRGRRTSRPLRQPTAKRAPAAKKQTRASRDTSDANVAQLWKPAVPSADGLTENGAASAQTASPRGRDAAMRRWSARIEERRPASPKSQKQSAPGRHREDRARAAARRAVQHGRPARRGGSRFGSRIVRARRDAREHRVERNGAHAVEVMRKGPLQRGVVARRRKGADGGALPSKFTRLGGIPGIGRRRISASAGGGGADEVNKIKKLQTFELPLFFGVGKLLKTGDRAGRRKNDRDARVSPSKSMRARVRL
jgi:hypothetical protein